MPSRNEAFIAAAGSGKTTLLIERALAHRDLRVLITTYTRENLVEIEQRLWKAAGREPHHVCVMSWFEFLLRECVKPYQAYKTNILGIRSINFNTRKASVPSLKYASKSEFDRYYVDADRNIYKDVVSDLACALDDASVGKVIARLARCYDMILIDEVQDLAGPDLDLLLRLFKSNVHVMVVGDPRQGIYTANTASKNKQYRRAGIVTWIDQQVSAGWLTKSTLSRCHRCNQAICDYADTLYPDLPPTTSTNNTWVEDAGVHLVHEDDVGTYRAIYEPQELRWNVKEKRAGAGALNMGEVKGMAFDRVLIHPTRTITDYIKRSADLRPITRAKLYVALTRARNSVAIVTNERRTTGGLSVWVPPSRAVSDGHLQFRNARLTNNFR